MRENWQWSDLNRSVSSSWVPPSCLWCCVDLSPSASIVGCCSTGRCSKQQLSCVGGFLHVTTTSAKTTVSYVWSLKRVQRCCVVIIVCHHWLSLLAFVSRLLWHKLHREMVKIWQPRNCRKIITAVNPYTSCLVSWVQQQKTTAHTMICSTSWLPG